MAKVKEQEKKDPREHYVIDTKTKSSPAGRDFTYMDYTKNPEVRKIMDKVAAGTLKDEHAGLQDGFRLCQKASNFIDREHNTPEVNVYSTDEHGLIWIPREDVKIAQKCLRDLQAVDPGVNYHPIGIPIPEEEKVEVTQTRSELRKRILG